MKWFFSCMCSYMTFQILLCRTFVTTKFALKWFDLIVYLSMSNHVCFHIEFLFTYVTFYWFFTCMNSGMCFQSHRGKKICWAWLTSKRFFFVTVNVHMSCQGITTRETCLANFTFNFFLWIRPLIQTCHEYRIKNGWGRYTKRPKTGF